MFPVTIYVMAAWLALPVAALLVRAWGRSPVFRAVMLRVVPVLLVLGILLLLAVRT